MSVFFVQKGVFCLKKKSQEKENTCIKFTKTS